MAGPLPLLWKSNPNKFCGSKKHCDTTYSAKYRKYSKIMGLRNKSVLFNKAEFLKPSLRKHLLGKSPDFLKDFTSNLMHPRGKVHTNGHTSQTREKILKGLGLV